MADNVAITPGTGVSIAADDVGSVLHQRIKRSVGGDGSATDFLDQKTRQETFTSTATGTAQDVSAQGMARFSLQVVQTGTVTSWTVVVERSIDGTNYDAANPVLKHMKTADGTETVSGDKAIASTSTPYPTLYFRTRCTELTLGAGTNVVATVVALP
jgi:hypothetical protein